jgi:hypothetical protein
MSTNWIYDINKMHEHYGVHEKMKDLTPEMLREYIKFRFRFLEEELTEGYAAIEESNPEEIVDALIDLVVVAIGTLNLFGINEAEAWDQVLVANMNKEVGIKASRPNKFGLPDLIKKEGWVGPDHSDNHGLLTKAFSD